LNYDGFEEEKKAEDRKSEPRTPSRKTPSALAKSKGGKTGKTANAMAIGKVDKFGAGNKAELLAQEKAEREKIKREADDQRKREAEDLKRKGGKNAAKNVIFAQYELDTRLNVYREVNPPPASLFIGLGWDETPDQKRKHYRRYYADELEFIKEVMPVVTPFDTYELKKGQSRGGGGLFSMFGGGKEDDSGAPSSE